MDDFIFSLEKIFNPEDGCLFLNKVKGFYIGPYQRGYKWKSKSVHDQIPVLLTDLYEAYLKSKESAENQEYYLQYITVKKVKSDSEEHFFEVIDGQQRLTTLTLLYNILENFYDIPNITKYKNEYLVQYARYEDENESIFEVINGFVKKIIADENSSILNSLYEQDKYYMIGASLCIYKFMSLLQKTNQDEFQRFIKFINTAVKLILNKEDESTSAEEIFANLNANKVPLTNAYLIKGLLLTKASRNISTTIRYKYFKEIMDQRAIMGRTWDEMTAWFSRPEVSFFFFGEKQNGMERMLELINFDGNGIDSKIIKEFRANLEINVDYNFVSYDLFNRFHDNIISSYDSVICLDRVKHTYKRLKSWYEDTDIYNLLGYRQATTTFADQNKERQNKQQYINDLLELDNNNLLEKLKRSLLNRLPGDKKETEKLKYSDKSSINKLLLALSVFPESEEGSYKKTNGQRLRFDFYSYNEEKWSLEHIFPQTPSAENIRIEEDSDWIIGQIRKRIDELKDSLDTSNEIYLLEQTILSIKGNKEINKSSIEWLYKIDDVNNLGNMALLSGGVNSALSNGFFDTKRKILLRKINSGSFVPKHTIDVFSKMLHKVDGQLFDPELIVWSNDDIIAHKQWLIDRVERLRNKMKLELDPRNN